MTKRFSVIVFNEDTSVSAASFDDIIDARHHFDLSVADMLYYFDIMSVKIVDNSQDGKLLHYCNQSRSSEF